MEKIKVMIAEDHQLFRNALASLLLENNLNVIGAAENGRVLIDLVRQRQPDIVILDLRMPFLNGHEVLKIFAKEYPGIKTIILSSEYQSFYVASVIINGAAAYLRKDGDPMEIVKAIRRVYDDGFYFNEVVSRDVLDQLKSGKKLYYIIENEKFTERQIEVLRELCKGYTEEQVAERLNVSKDTVRHYKRELFEKTDCKNTVLLAQYAMKQGMLDNV